MPSKPKIVKSKHIPTSMEFMEIYNANKHNKQQVINEISALAIHTAASCQTTFNYTLSNVLVSEIVALVKEDYDVRVQDGTADQKILFFTVKDAEE